MKTHNLKKFKTTKKLAKWYDQKYKDMGMGWQCPKDAAESYISFIGLPISIRLKLLDVGCGDGDFLSHVVKYIPNSIGMDISEVAIDMAKKRELSAQFVVHDIEKIEADANIFDYITYLGSLEHCINIDKALSNTYTLLKNDGRLWVYVPNEEWQHFDQPNETTHTDKEWLKIFEINNFKMIKHLRINDCSQFLLVKDLP